MNKENKYNKVIKILETTLPSTPPLSAQAKMSLMAAILHSEFKHWLFCGFYVKTLYFIYIFFVYHLHIKVW